MTCSIALTWKPSIFPNRGEFDYILLADVLEHLKDPGGLLRRVVPCLNDGGEIIISIPNVAHLFVRLRLMLGHFEYQDRGILDRTHLRFFTLASMRRMIDDASCRILELRPHIGAHSVGRSMD